MAEWDAFNSLILSETNGVVSFQDLIEGLTYRDESDEQTGHKDKVVTEGRERNLTPAVLVTTEDGRPREYSMPVRARIQVEEGDFVQAGQALAKIFRQTAKTGDITGGLPRVTELFEARQPTDAAVVSEIDGEITFGRRVRGAQEVVVTSRDGSIAKTYLVPLSKHLLVFENDYVRAGDPLSDGQISPQDILRIKGAFAVQSYLVNEVQEVYRLQGVTINDKHIEVIVRQMMQKVTILDPGDTEFLEDDLVDRFELEEKNNELFDKFVVLEAGDTRLKLGEVVDRKKLREHTSEMKRQDMRPPEVREARQATAEPTLLGITQASLSTDSFISAASFQETTKVLTHAAVQAKTDYLRGLKENVIVGHLVPAGTGLRKYRQMVVTPKTEMEVARSERELIG